MKMRACGRVVVMVAAAGMALSVPTGWAWAQAAAETPANAPANTPAPASAPAPGSGESEADQRASMAALAAAQAGAAKPEARGATRPRYALDSEGRWVLAEEPEPGSDGAFIAAARRDIAEGRPGAAKASLDRWISKNERTGNPLLPAAYLARGDAITAAGNEYKALYDYEVIGKSFPGAEEYVIAAERQLEIAVRYVRGLKRKWLGIRWFDASDVGEELLIRIQERLPGSRLAERAGIELANHFYRERELSLANDAYEVFLLNYPRSSYRMSAMMRRIYANIGRFKGPMYDGSALLDAGVLIRRFMAEYPQQARATGLDDSLLTRIDESAAASILESARWYLRRDDAVSARSMLRRVIRQHPISDAARQAREIMSENGWTMPGEKPAEMIPDQATPASAGAGAGAGAAAGTDGAVNAPPVPPRPDGPAVPAGPGNAEGKK